MLQPLKMQGEARNGKNKRFGPLRAQLRAQRAHYPKTNHAGTGVLPRRTFGPIFVALRQFLLPIVHSTVLNGGDPPVAFLLRKGLKKGTSSLRSEVNKPSDNK